MHVHHLSAIVFTVLVLTVSCKKDEEQAIDVCLNGKLDAGETAIDCGGSCAPCPVTEYPYAGFSVNGTALSASVKEIDYSTVWSLHVANDSVTVQMNLGNNGTVGTYQMDPAGCSVVYNGVAYNTMTSGVYSLSSHNTTTHKLSGYFQGKFIRPAFPLDTLYISNGFFEHLAY